MKYGIAIRNMGPQSNPATFRACARIAEDAGFDALFVSDHLCIPPDQTEGSGGRYYDVLAALAWLAGITNRIRIGVSVLVLPYRPAVLTAKQVATIQELSGERMILGDGTFSGERRSHRNRKLLGQRLDRFPCLGRNDPAAGNEARWSRIIP